MLGHTHTHVLAVASVLTTTMMIIIVTKIIHTLADTTYYPCRELEYVTNYQTYVDFCRVEIFQATRPTPQNWFRRKR